MVNPSQASFSAAEDANTPTEIAALLTTVYQPSTQSSKRAQHLFGVTTTLTDQQVDDTLPM